MSNLAKYDSAFTDTFQLQAADLASLKYQDNAAWDSVGHMQLMAALEDVFSIEMDIDDIIEFSSYQVGKGILGKYGVTI